MKTGTFCSLLLLAGFMSSNVFAQKPNGSTLVLRDNWAIQSSATLKEDGTVISQPGYAAKDC